MITCYLGLGSNLRSPERQIRRALRALRTLPASYRGPFSPLEKTVPWGVQARQPAYCNAVVVMTTRLTPIALLRACQKLEKAQGRVRKKHYGPRTLDIDILQYGNRRMHTPRLTLPHPRIDARDFVKIPLENLAATRRVQRRDSPVHKA